MQRHRKGALVGTVVLALGLFAALRARWMAPDAQVDAGSAALRRQVPTLNTGVAATRAPSLRETSHPTPAPQANLAAATAQDLRERARYPHSSQPLRTGDGDPILREREVSQSVFPGPNGDNPALVIFPDQVSFEHPETITLHAYLTSDDARVPARSIRGEIVDAAGKQVGQVDYVDTGLDPDRRADDLEYTARLTETESSALANGPYLIRVRAITDSGEERTGTTGFLYSRPRAQPTGNYADAIVDGSLEIRAEVQVEETGRFHLEGTLYTTAGTPLAWAQNALTLSPGTHWIPLSFFGLILHDHGEDGPYVLRVAALSTVTTMPNAKNRLVENAHVTSPYRAADFSDQPYNDPHLLDAAKRLEQAGSMPRLEADSEQ